MNKKNKIMKKNILKTIGASALLAAIIMSNGCVAITTHKQVLTKQTIFGFQLANNPTAGIAGILPAVQFGMIRGEYISNPTSTNQVYAAPISSQVNADLGMLSQHATENQSFGK